MFDFVSADFSGLRSPKNGPGLEHRLGQRYDFGLGNHFEQGRCHMDTSENFGHACSGEENKINQERQMTLSDLLHTHLILVMK